MILVDTNVLLDLVTGDRLWAEWSQQQLDLAAAQDEIAIKLMTSSMPSFRWVMGELKTSMR